MNIKNFVNQNQCIPATHRINHGILWHGEKIKLHFISIIKSVNNIIFNRISDKLIEELIIEITEELQMNNIIKKLFEMEFQEL